MLRSKQKNEVMYKVMSNNISTRYKWKVKHVTVEAGSSQEEAITVFDDIKWGKSGLICCLILKLLML